MDHWMERQLRSRVLSDLDELIPERYFERDKDKFTLKKNIDETGFLSNELRWGYLAGAIGRKLYFDTELLMSPRQKSASEVLMNLGMYVGAQSAETSCLKVSEIAKKLNIQDGNAADVSRKLQDEQIPALKENVHGALARYLSHLSHEEANPFRVLLPSNNQVSLSPQLDKKVETKMYNLFVSSNSEAWDQSPYFLETSRCVREYTDPDITSQYGEFTEEQVDSIRQFPCVFAYERLCKEDVKFGFIKDITSRQGKVKIEFEIIDLPKFLTSQCLTEMYFELDIIESEMYRTHWAIKKVNLYKELLAKNIVIPNQKLLKPKLIDVSEHIFDVAFSFPGEVRNYVQNLASEVERVLGPSTYFYDGNYKAQLARPSLDILLEDIYRNRSKLIVVFLCEKYQDKEWCGIEFRVIKEIIMKREHSKVMFVKMDEGSVEGVLSTDGYIDGRIHSPRELAGFVQERLSLLG